MESIDTILEFVQAGHILHTRADMRGLFLFLILPDCVDFLISNVRFRDVAIGRRT